MTESEGKLRVLLITFFPMLIATLSLVTSIFNGYLNNKFVDLIQRNFGRAEYMRTCKEAIDAYFQVKFKTGLVSANGEQSRAGTAAASSAQRIDAEAAVNKFAALGTYLANLRARASGRVTPSWCAGSRRPWPIRAEHRRLSLPACSKGPTRSSPS
jgi:hypothetical protein